MIPSKRRIPKGFFQALQRPIETLQGSHFSFRFYPNQGPSRFSVVVSKKVAHTAVIRNSVRRKAYRAISHLLPFVKRGFLVVLLFKKNKNTPSTDDIKMDVSKSLKDAGLLE